MNDSYEKRIQERMDQCLTETDFDYGQKYQGKVRDTYDLGDKLIIVTTDRQSAFDRLLAAVPFKGQVLNLISAWWFEKTKDRVANHLLAVPDPNVSIVRKCKVFPIEFVVRGYITGTTSTSLWTQYQKGLRSYCGYSFPDGLKKNQVLDKPIITPTTKEVEHDRPLSPEAILSEGLMTEEDWEKASTMALELYHYGVEVAAKQGLILVDTKYEFAKDEQGQLVLVDELHTPDSSRYWLADTYQSRLLQNKEPENIDKECLRLWFVQHCDPYHDKVLPKAPEDLIIELARKYIQLYEMLTGQHFPFADSPVSQLERISLSLDQYLASSRGQ